MPSFVEIGLPVLEENILRVFTIYLHGGHLGHVTYFYWLSLLIDASTKIWLCMAMGFQRRRSYKGSGELKSQHRMALCSADH